MMSANELKGATMPNVVMIANHFLIEQAFDKRVTPQIGYRDYAHAESERI